MTETRTIRYHLTRYAMSAGWSEVSALATRDPGHPGDHLILLEVDQAADLLNEWMVLEPAHRNWATFGDAMDPAPLSIAHVDRGILNLSIIEPMWAGYHYSAQGILLAAGIRYTIDHRPNLGQNGA